MDNHGFGASDDLICPECDTVFEVNNGDQCPVCETEIESDWDLAESVVDGLEPCFWCGSEDLDFAHIRADGKITLTSPTTTELETFWIRCKNCSIRTPHMHNHSELFNKWQQLGRHSDAV